MADFSIMICAGESSGDLHAANLIQPLKELQPSIHVRAMGGEKLAAMGAEILVDCRDIAVIAFWGVIKNWRKIQNSLNCLKQSLKNNPPNLLILVDYAEFNLKLARYAKTLGVKVLFYISPKVWAWRPGRVPKIGQSIDMMAVIFPFETEIYKKHNIPVRFVGHPLADMTPPNLDCNEAQLLFGLQPGYKTVALLPGSRKSEIQHILRSVLESARLIQRAMIKVQFLLPIASTLSRDDFGLVTTEYCELNVRLVDRQAYNVINVSDSAIVASGTASLEVALLGIPMCIIYKTDILSYAIISRLLKIDYVGLPNIIADRGIVPEFIQNDASPDRISTEIIKQLTDEKYSEKLKRGLAEVKERLGSKGSSKRLAMLVNEMLLDGYK